MASPTRVIRAGFAAMPVADLGRALAWYEQFMGRPPDLVPNEREGCWQIVDTSWIYVIADEERAGRGLFTLVVDDLDSHLAELEQRGVEVDELQEIPGVLRRALVTDPEGNTIGFGQPLG